MPWPAFTESANLLLRTPAALSLAAVGLTLWLPLPRCRRSSPAGAASSKAMSRMAVSWSFWPASCSCLLNSCSRHPTSEEHAAECSDPPTCLAVSFRALCSRIFRLNGCKVRRLPFACNRLSRPSAPQACLHEPYYPHQGYRADNQSALQSRPQSLRQTIARSACKVMRTPAPAG